MIPRLRAGAARRLPAPALGRLIGALVPAVLAVALGGYMALGGMALSAFFGLLILTNHLAILVLDPCRQ